MTLSETILRKNVDDIARRCAAAIAQGLLAAPPRDMTPVMVKRS
jgi:hypothetical protein